MLPVVHYETLNKHAHALLWDAIAPAACNPPIAHKFACQSFVTELETNLPFDQEGCIYYLTKTLRLIDD